MTDLKDQLKESYINWLMTNLKMNDLSEDVIEITSPLMDRHNDYLQIYAVRQGDKIRLTDDGYIISDLLLSGCDIFTSTKRKEIFQIILNGFGVQKTDDDALFTYATISNFPQKKHMLLQAMLAVNDMFMTTKANAISIFWEEVSEFIFQNDIRAVENIQFTGKTGFNHRFDFAIPRSKKSPERIIQTINNPTRDRSTNLIFAWDDTKNTRQPGSKLYAFLNDSDRTISSEILSAFSQYDIKIVLWSQRNIVIDELIA